MLIDKGLQKFTRKFKKGKYKKELAKLNKTLEINSEDATVLDNRG